MLFLSTLVFLATTILFFLILVLPILALFELIDRELAWFITRLKIKNSLRIVKKECTKSRSYIAYSNTILLSKLPIMIIFSKVSVQIQT